MYNKQATKFVGCWRSRTQELRAWNSLPEDIRAEPDVAVFRTHGRLSFNLSF